MKFPVKSRILCITFVLLLTISINQVSASTLTDYSEEYDYEGEKCSFKDQFYYIGVAENNKEVFLLTTVLECCEDEKCITLFFDEDGEKEFNQKGAEDIAHGHHIRNKFRDGSFSENIYKLDESFNLCEFYDVGVLRDQSISAAVEGTEIGAEIFYPKKVKQVKEATGLLKGLGIAKRINPYEIGASVVCTSQLNKRQEVVQKIANCYVMVTEIKNGIVHANAVQELETCNSEAKAQLNIIIESTSQQMIDLANKVSAAVKGLLDFATNPTEELEIEETEYEKLKQLRDRIGGDLQLKNPNAISLSLASINRLNEKKTDAEAQILLTEQAIIDAKLNDNSNFEFEFNNIFYDPNKNYSIHRDFQNKAQNKLNEAKSLFSVRKYNSAILKAQESQEESIRAKRSLQSLLSLEQTFDKRWKNGLIVAGILLLTFIIILVFIVRKAKNEWRY